MAAGPGCLSAGGDPVGAGLAVDFSTAISSASCSKSSFGWLCIPETDINYPVMHTPDNPEKYLRRNFQGEYSESGVPFLDSRCVLDSDNLIITVTILASCLKSSFSFCRDSSSRPIINPQTSRTASDSKARITNLILRFIYSYLKKLAALRR